MALCGRSSEIRTKYVGLYLIVDSCLLSDMRNHDAEHRVWRTLSADEKQHRLAGLRLSQQQQVARDARVLLLVRAG